MASTLRHIDWTLVRSFLAVAEEGSLSAAARRLEMTQPSIGRHVKLLEDALGVSLFTRVHRGLELTETGQTLLAPARDMLAASVRLELAAEGRSERLSGTVRITASEVVSHYHLPQIFAAIRMQEPDIQLELVPSDTSENLLFREADIAIRMYRPSQLDVVTRHVGNLPVGLYAAKSYLARKGPLKQIEDTGSHDFIGFDKSDMIIRIFREMGLDVDRNFFPVRTDSQAIYWEMVRMGCGIGASQRAIGDADPLVERLDIDLPMPPMQIWLTAPEVLKTNPRIRRVYDLLGDAVGRISER